MKTAYGASAARLFLVIACVSLLVSISAQPAIATENVLSGVPYYDWWYGCSPTAGGALLAYWDQRSDANYYWGNIYIGDASVWDGNGNWGPPRMVASTAHIVSGSQNGYTWGDWHNSTSYPNHESNPECVADYMKTLDSGTDRANIGPGVTGYLGWDDPATPGNEAYQATAEAHLAPYYGGDFDYSAYKAEVDADRPVLLSVLTRYGLDVFGHTIVGYGYRDNMFNVKVPVGAGVYDYLTVGGMAVMDTWGENDTSLSDWIGWSNEKVNPVIEDGVEWWPFILSTGYSFTSSYDWMVRQGTTLDVEGWVRGDANHDGKVSVGDLGILAVHYGTASGMLWEQGDFSGDGAVSVGDLGILASHYGFGTGSLPEPSSVALILLSLAWVRRK